MLRKGSSFFLIIHQIIDLGIVTASFYLAYETKIRLPGTLGGLASDYKYSTLLLLAFITFHISLRLFGAYAVFRKLTLKELVSNIFKGAVTGTAGVIFLGYAIHLESVSRLFLLLFCVYSFLGLTLFKGTLYKLLAHSRRKDYNIRYILVVGTRRRARDFIKNVWERKESGYRIMGCLETNDQAGRLHKQVYKSVTIIGTMDSFKDILENKTVDEIVFAMPLKDIKNAQDYIYFAEEMGKSVRILPDFQINKLKYYPQTAKVIIDDFIGVTTLALSSGPKNDNELLLKSIVDYLSAFVGVILFSPLLLFICLAIKCTSKGPVFFSQERLGLNGRRFKLHKFRTMVIDAEQMQEALAAENEMEGPVFKIKKDPRITFVGSLLRKTSLDELPQLFNILKGEMSLVGPRPPIPSEVKGYKLWQRRRLSMKPGLTCIWQVSGRNDISFEQWMNMDLEYIDNWSLKLDAKLLLRTVKEVVAWGGR